MTNSVYLYHGTDRSWTRQVRFFDSSIPDYRGAFREWESGPGLGASLALSGDTALTGDTGYDSVHPTTAEAIANSGRVHAFRITFDRPTPAIRSIRREGNEVWIECSGIPGRHYTFEYSTDLQTWTPIQGMRWDERFTGDLLLPVPVPDLPPPLGRSLFYRMVER